jgi:hypothetical protein
MTRTRQIQERGRYALPLYSADLSARSAVNLKYIITVSLNKKW